MTIAEIKELINIVTESGVAELEVQRGDSRVRIRRTAGLSQEVILPSVAAAPVLAAAPAPVHAAPSAHTVSASPSASHVSGGASAKPQTLEDGHELVKSPIVGTYYDSPAPGAAPFVRVGDNVEPGQVLCIIESMKLMNEIESEVAGTIVAKLVENGRPVEYGEALFAIRPR
jgi:acetyl-CoA carboxylase biotin carboxyl carrier protein